MQFLSKILYENIIYTPKINFVSTVTQQKIEKKLKKINMMCSSRRSKYVLAYNINDVFSYSSISQRRIYYSSC